MIRQCGGPVTAGPETPSLMYCLRDNTSAAAAANPRQWKETVAGQWNLASLRKFLFLIVLGTFQDL
jgi:hypothetical protein